MEPTIITSLIGIAIFSTIMYSGFKYASGKWKVSESKNEAYLHWLSKHGKTIKKSIIIISILYGLGMTIQLLSLI